MIQSMKTIMAVTVSCVLGLSACNKAPENTAPAPQQSAEQTQTMPAKENQSSLPADAPVYTVGTISSFPPFVESDEFGKAEGFDMDILNAIGESQGFKVEFVIQPWQGLLDTLNTEAMDIVATGVVITPERQEIYDFSDPYLDTQWAAMMIAKDGQKKYESFEEVMAEDLTYVTQVDSAGVDAVKKSVGDDLMLLVVEGQFQELEAVAQGGADVAYDISRVLQYYANTDFMKKYNFYMLPDQSSEVQNFGYVVKKGNTDLVQKINTGLADIKSNGTYDEIYKKWFGESK